MRTITVLSALLMAGLLTACSSDTATVNNAGSGAESPSFKVGIRWTSYGIPHVKAEDWASLGYGFAYATAVDGVCVIARDLVMVDGELAKHIEDNEENRASDIFHRALLTPEAFTAFTESQSDTSNQFSEGYVAGYNRYLRDYADKLPASCADQAWVRPMTDEDVAKLAIGVAIRYGLGRMQKEIAAAAPPTADKLAGLGIETDFDAPKGYGSNAVGMGRAATETGRGLLLGNPHYPWQGSSRFHMIHTTIPGTVDVMGVSLLTTPRVAIGFNKDVAWTHTVSTALRATLYQLELHPQDPLRYRYGEDWKSITPQQVNLADGSTHTVYMSHYGPVLASEQLPWNDQVAFAIRDANLNNLHTAATYDALSVARDTREVEAAISRGGVAWTNTIAADRHGNAFYADISVTPNVDAELIGQCRIKPEGMPDRVVILRGSDPACEWREDPRARTPGLLPPEEMPRLHREDFVSNSNDSYWLTNPSAPLEGYSPIIGNERSKRSLRTRAGLVFIEEALKDDGKVSQQALQDMLYSHRNYGAELLLDDLLGLCSSETQVVEFKDDEADISRSCAALKQWDRRNNPESRGGHLWREFWYTARKIEGVFAADFELDNPVHTPYGLATDDPEVRKRLLKSLARAQLKLDEANIALDAPLGEIQFSEINGERIAAPGGEGWAGMWSMIVSYLEPDLGYSPITHGNSYIQAISWDADGTLRPRGILTYSQSPEPDSPHAADQTRLYAEGGWLDLPFTDADINADPNLVKLELEE